MCVALGSVVIQTISAVSGRQSVKKEVHENSVWFGGWDLCLGMGYSGRRTFSTFGTLSLSLESQNLHASKVFSDNSCASSYRWGNSYGEVEWLLHSYIALSSSPSFFTFSLPWQLTQLLLLKKRRDRLNWARSQRQCILVLLPPLVMLEYSPAQYFFSSLFPWWL